MHFVDFVNLERDYDIINIGSGPSKYDFDWSAVSAAKGYNFAVAPEDFRYDARILKHYGKYVKKNGTVLIIITPLSFAENKYLQKDWFSCKYVNILPPQDVDLPLWKYRMLKNPIGLFIVENLRRMTNIPYHIFNLFTSPSTLSPEKSLVAGWLKENPYLRNLKDLPKGDLSSVFEIKRNDFNTIIDICLALDLKPVLILPPMSKTLNSFFSDSFLKIFVYDVLENISKDIPIFDYMTDEKYKNDDYFSNGLFLKKKYAQMFTKDVWMRIHTIYPDNNRSQK